MIRTTIMALMLAVVYTVYLAKTLVAEISGDVAWIEDIEDELDYEVEAIEQENW